MKYNISMNSEVISKLEFFEKLLEITRRETYFTLITIIISIAIFAAGLLNSEKKSIEKRMIIDNLHIGRVIYLSIALVFLMWLEPIVTEGNYFGKCFILIIEMVFDLCVFCSYVKTIVLMYQSMKLSGDDMYYSKHIKKYIEKRTEDIENNENKTKNNYKINQIGFANKLRNSNCSSYEYGKFIFKDDYIGLLANFDGLVMDIKKSSLPKKNFYGKEIDGDSILYIRNVLGEYINRGDIVCYCNKSYANNYKDTKNYFIIDEKIYPHKKQFSEIIEWLFSNAVIGEGEFDNDNSIKNYIIFLYQNDKKRALGLIIEKIEDYYYEIKNNKLKIKHYYYFIKSIRNLALKYDDFESYIKLDDIVLSCYYNLIDFYDLEDNINSINTSMSMLLYDLKNKESKYYDYSLSNYLKLIYYQIRERKYNNVYELINENYTIFDHYEIKNKNIKIINFSFICGIVKGLLTKWIETKSKNEEDKKIINKIFEYINNENSNYDGVDIVDIYKKISHISPYVSGVCNKCEMYIEKHKTGAFFNINEINEIDLLINMLNILGNTVFLEQKYKTLDYKMEDKYFYKEFREKIEKNNVCEDLITNTLDNSNVKEYLDYAIAECEKNENKYIISVIIENDVFVDYESRVRKEIFKKIDLLSILDDKSKIIYDDSDDYERLSLSYFMPRQTFIEYETYKEMLIDPIKNSFDSAIIDRYCNYINDNYRTYSNLEELKKEIDYKNEYLVFINEGLYYEKYINEILESDKLKNSNLHYYYNSYNIVGIKAIEVSKLPTIYIDSRCQNISKNHVQNGIYVEVYDLANNESKIEEIININKKEKRESLLSKVLLNVMINVKIH